MEDTVVYRNSHGEEFSLPASLIDSWTPSQKRYMDSQSSRYDKTTERYAKLAWEIYYKAAYGIPLLAPLAPRHQTAFQFWLRTNLERLGLI